MVALLVTGHGKFATGICSALDLIAGKNKHILAVDFEMEDSTDDLLMNLEAAFAKLKEVNSIVVFSDIVGGSPFKIASELKYKYMDKDIEIVTGTNLPMLIKAFTLMDLYNDALDMAKMVVESGKSQVLRPEFKEHRDDVGEDGI